MMVMQASQVRAQIRCTDCSGSDARKTPRDGAGGPEGDGDTGGDDREGRHNDSINKRLRELLVLLLLDCFWL